jgi:hypothetical protein
MMTPTVRKSQTVYAADGTCLGRVLQCDSHFVVIGRGRLTSDHIVVPLEEVAASGSDVLFLRALPSAVLPETAEPWTPPADASGNANGVDLEPLRVGMAEIEDKNVGIAPPPGESATDRPPAEERDAPLPSPDDVWRLDCERIARLDAEIDECLVEELEDFEIGAACAPPAGEEMAGPSRDLVERPPEPAATGEQREERPAPRVTVRPARTLTPAAMRALRSARRFEHVLRRAGFSRVEASAIAAGGFKALASLLENLRQPDDDSLPT